MGWGFRIEWDQSAGDIDAFATAVLRGRISPEFAWSEDDRTQVYRISTTSPGLLSREAAALLAHQLAAEIRGKVNERRGESSLPLPEPAINLFEHGP